MKTDIWLAHHGILGQKWGVRRFQNKDGSLTSAGKKRYSYEENTAAEKEKRYSPDNPDREKNFKEDYPNRKGDKEDIDGAHEYFKEQKEYFHEKVNSERLKKATIIGAAAAATALAAYGGYKLYKSGKLNPILDKYKQTGENKSLNLDLQFFAKKRAKDKQYVFKTKQEAARFNNAVSQLSNEDKQKSEIAIDIEVTDNKNKGAYTYFAKNQDGYGYFKPYGRKKIKGSATGILERNDNDE